MGTVTLEKKIKLLSDDQKLKLEAYADALLKDTNGDKSIILVNTEEIEERVHTGRPVFGSGKGIFGKMADDFDEPLREKKLKREFGSLKGFVTYMADDFDAPLEDFKDYM